ncbi:MAG: hypothetical protein NTX52_13585 [Planctomycetota bacterium]|nr:hypothetical protein [Planctomycetota bacterium]
MASPPTLKLRRIKSGHRSTFAIWLRRAGRVFCIAFLRLRSGPQTTTFWGKQAGQTCGGVASPCQRHLINY